MAFNDCVREWWGSAELSITMHPLYLTQSFIEESRTRSCLFDSIGTKQILDIFTMNDVFKCYVKPSVTCVPHFLPCLSVQLFHLQPDNCLVLTLVR